MLSRDESNAKSRPIGGVFHTTHWSVVLHAKETDTPEAGGALELLCRTYYYPLYTFVRRQGHGPYEAQDLTQEFFYRFLSKDYMASVDREKGRFRSFLLASLKHFLGAARVRNAAIKRGGQERFVALDAENVEERYLLDAKSEQPPEIFYDRGWATTLMGRALRGLREEFQAEGKGDLFERLRIFLSREPREGEYTVVAAGTNTTPGAVSVAVHRLRQRYGQRVRAEVANTVAHPTDVEEEVRHLFAVLTAELGHRDGGSHPGCP
jgi:DNA-directed RNA polymerase specialized sigma24 family protein